MNELVPHMMNSSKELKKPLVLALHNAFSPKAYQAFSQDQEICWQAGIPSFRSLDRTAQALDKLIKYHEKRA